MVPWSPGARVAPAFVTLLLVSMIVPLAPAGGAWQPSIVPAPTVGMTVDAQFYLGPTELTFQAPVEMLFGYHEWRPVVFAVPPEGLQLDVGAAFDLETGLDLGLGFDIDASGPVVPSLPPQVLRSGPEHRLITPDPLGVNAWLPEHVLWGRWLSDGATWEVPSWSARTGLDASVLVAAPWGSDEASVWIESSQSYPGGSFKVSTQWWINFTGEWKAFGDERLRRVVVYEDNVPTYTGAWTAHPVDILAPGGEEIDFAGRSHAQLVGPRDQNLRYGPMDDLPFDPQPHAWFDVRQAAVVAFAAEHESIRAFKAKAVDPHLKSAWMGHAPRGGVTWCVEFIEAAGAELRICYLGAKVPFGPLVFLEDLSITLVHGQYGYMPPGARASGEWAAAGDYARLIDQVAAERSQMVLQYEIEAQFSEAIGTRGSLQAHLMATPVYTGQGPNHYVRADAASGIVQTYVQSEHGFRTDLGP